MEQVRDANAPWMSRRDLQRRLGKAKFVEYEQFLVTTCVPVPPLSTPPRLASPRVWRTKELKSEVLRVVRIQVRTIGSSVLDFWVTVT